MDSGSKKSVLQQHVIGRESELIGRYLSGGPAELKSQLGLKDEEFFVVFEYLVFEYNLLYKCVLHASEFFVEQYVKWGMTHVRELLGVGESQYDRVCEPIFDLIAIAHEGLRYHVIQHRERYGSALRMRGRDFVRKVLGVWHTKYQQHWQQTLEVLLSVAAREMCTAKTLDTVLCSYGLHYNGLRSTRPLI